VFEPDPEDPALVVVLGVLPVPVLALPDPAVAGLSPPLGVPVAADAAPVEDPALASHPAAGDGEVAEAGVVVVDAPAGEVVVPAGVADEALPPAAGAVGEVVVQLELAGDPVMAVPAPAVSVEPTSEERLLAAFRLARVECLTGIAGALVRSAAAAG